MIALITTFLPGRTFWKANSRIQARNHWKLIWSCSRKAQKATWKTEEEKHAYGLLLKDFLKYETSNSQRLELLQQIFEALNDVAPAEKLMMSWDDIRQLKSDGFSIGSHTKTHPLLETISNQDELRTELTDSAARIKTEIGTFPETISYPNGSSNEMVVGESKACGYKLGLAVRQRFYNPQKDNLFQIPRVELYQESWFKTKLRINGTISGIKNMMGRVEH